MILYEGDDFTVKRRIDSNLDLSVHRIYQGLFKLVINHARDS